LLDPQKRRLISSRRRANDAFRNTHPGITVREHNNGQRRFSDAPARNSSSFRYRPTATNTPLCFDILAKPSSRNPIF